MSAPPAPPTALTPSRAVALSQLLTLPNLGLNLFLAAAFLLIATSGHPTWWVALLVLLAFFGARNAGHAFNQLVDRRLDAENPRTQLRPLVTGALSTRLATGVVVVNTAIFFVAAFLLRPWLVLLTLPALGLVLGYSYTKRYTPLTTVVLGTVQGLLPAGVYLAIDGTVPLLAWVAIGAMVLFGTAFESVHSLRDVEADRHLGLRSLPLSVGVKNAPGLVAFLLAGALALLLGYGIAAIPHPLPLIVACALMGLVAGWEVRGLWKGDTPLLRLFRAHFAMGGLFLLGVVACYALPAFGLAL